MGDKPTINYDTTTAQSYATYRDASPAVVEHLVERLSRLGVGSILEMGCGTADYLAVLTRTTNARGFGFDDSPAMLEQARQKNPGLVLSRADAEGAFPFENDSFDACFSVNLVHYLRDLRTFFTEAYRVAKPGAVVVTVTDSEEDIRGRTMSEYFPERVEIELRRYPAISEIRSAMEAAAWTAVELTHTKRTFPLTSSILEKYRRKACSALRLIPQPCFEAGMARLTKEFAEGGVMVRELYTYVWGRK